LLSEVIETAIMQFYANNVVEKTYALLLHESATVLHDVLTGHN